LSGTIEGEAVHVPGSLFSHLQLQRRCLCIEFTVLVRSVLWVVVLVLSLGFGMVLACMQAHVSANMSREPSLYNVALCDLRRSYLVPSKWANTHAQK
jgi:hypothetical protein